MAIPPPSRSGRKQQGRRPLSLSEAYFAWLYDLVFDPSDDPSENYVAVCGFMHRVIFQIMVSHDENRVAEAAGLRNGFRKFAGSLGPGELSELLTPDASLFEVLIALTARADFIVPLGRKVWFRIFLENLKLDKWNDLYSRTHSTFAVESIIHRFNNRHYNARGVGGIFPLRKADKDQREVELWYQMGQYMTENGMY